MSDILYWDKECNNNLNELSRLIKVIEKGGIDDDDEEVHPKLSSSEKIEYVIKQFETKLLKTRDVVKSFGLELRLCKDKVLRTQYEIKLTEYNSRVKMYNESIKNFKTSNQRSNLMNNNEIESVKPQTTREFLKGKTNDEVLMATGEIQGKTFESLGRTRAMIENSRDVGEATLGQLRQQRNQMGDVFTKL